MIVVGGNVSFPAILPGVTFTYVAVVAVQLAVLLALWWLSGHFS
ncbi:MAG: hypothetical protein V3T48_04670 [Vicinamibacterales bacterium]